MLKPKHLLSLRTSLLACLLWGAGIQACFAQISKLAPAEIERRNAATTFVQLSGATLQLLRMECGTMMPTQAAHVEAIARAWFDRNKDDIVAANVWADQYVSYAKSISPEAHQRVSLALATALANGLTARVKLHFKREQPNTESCNRALLAYTAPQLDFQNMGKTPGYEQFGEFGETLKAFRSTSEYTIPVHIDTTFQERNPFKAIASLDAAQAARERGDGVAMRAILTNMASYRDGAAAQSVGLSFLNGELTPKDNALAYRWFSAAWGLDNFDGLNAMGVMLRDGLGVEVNTGIAYGAFLLAVQGARTRASHDLAKSNVDALQDKILPDDRKTLACMTLENFEAALKKPTSPLPQIPGSTLLQGQRKLGHLIRALDGVTLAECQ